jgi:hypothetical protein
MLPPVLEIYVVWHPRDIEGKAAAEQILGHFHGTTFSGLIGGAVEVYMRSEPWAGDGGAPRPLPFTESFPNGVAAPELVAIVPVLGRELTLALEQREGPWHDYIAAIAAAHADEAKAVCALPLAIDEGVLDKTRLGELLGQLQQIGQRSDFVAEPASERRCRDLAQALAQFASGDPAKQIQVFVSHTKRYDEGGADRLYALIKQARYLIANTRLRDFFDANALQAGTDWASELMANASTDALLALRTDLYATREWCQREVLSAKTAGVPVVILDALEGGEERGSFLMDHVPRIPGGAEPSDDAIMRALNQLVDECLKRALWARQHALVATRDDLEVAWWAPHAPEPVTLTTWLRTNGVPASGPLRILHPDPPLGPPEVEALEELAALAGAEGQLEMMTPRGLATRGV